MKLKTGVAWILAALLTLACVKLTGNVERVVWESLTGSYALDEANPPAGEQDY